MRIDAIELYHVAMPLIYPFRTAYGSDDCIESVLVHLRSGNAEGWGEASPLRSPTYSPEWAYGVFLTMREWLAPLLLGQDIASGEQLQRTLASIKGNQFAKGGLDLAWWDLYAHLQGQPLWQLIGGHSPVIAVGADFGVMETLDALLAEIGKAQEAGFQRTKLKFRPGWDINMVAAVRERFPDIVMHIDCNSAYRLSDRVLFRELERFNLAMIEQPLAHDDLLDHATLQAELRTPICLDETINSPARARHAIALRACRWVNIKPARVGGLTQALAIHDICQEAGIPCWIGGMLESAVGQAFNTALATLPNVRYPSDVFPTSRYYRQDLGDPATALSGPSQITATSEPGIGCAPHAERLAKQTLHQATLTA
jgi:o-succinylbenzoate synthase